MKEITGNIWDHMGNAIIAITSNGSVSRKGRAVMGRGVARQAAEIVPELPEILGRMIINSGNHVHYLGHDIVSFPVEHSPFENPDLRLIRRSAEELVKITDEHGWKTVVIPRPGCGGGGLSWKEVGPLLQGVLDDRFIIISPQA